MRLAVQGFISVSQFPYYSSILSNFLSLKIKIKNHLEQEKKQVKYIYKDQVLQTYLIHKFFDFCIMLFVLY